MKKSILPKNWVVCSSKSYPDRVYYFNTVTNKASWVEPPAEAGSQGQSSPPKKGNSKKRKKGSESEVSRPTTPEMTQDTERPVLHAKRRISLFESKPPNETPQMREIRERMLQKQAKLSKALKPDTPAKKETLVEQPKTKLQVTKVADSKLADAKVPETKVPGSKAVTSKVSNDKKDTKEPENKVAAPTNVKGRFSEPGKPLPRRPGRRQSTAGSEISTKEEVAGSPAPATDQNMTPQMRLLYEKIAQKNALKTGSPRKSLASSAQSPSSSSTTSSSSSSSGSTSGTSSSSGTTSVSSSSPSSKASSRLSPSKEPVVPSPSAHKARVTRRRSRLSTLSSVASAASNLTALPEDKEPEEVEPEENQQEEKPPSTSSNRRTRRTIFIQDETDKAEPDTTFHVASPYPATKYPKNLAKKRLDDLRRSLSLEKESNESQISRKRMSLAVNPSQSPNVSSNRLVNDDPGPEPNFYTNSTSRSKALRDRILTYQSCSSKVNKAARQKDVEPEAMENEPVLSRLKDFNNDPYYEEMEWEPIEDEKIMSEVQAVRTQLYDTRSMNDMNVIQENILELPPEPVQNKKSLYIVVDTNVFLSNIQAIEEARDSVFKSFGRPFIAIPWTVIKELDFIKDDKNATRSESLKAKARRAVRFLYQHFSAKHPRVLGQKAEDVARNKEQFAIDCPDDEILQSCLQIREAGRSVVLLSYDKNLCNKAMIHDIATLGRDDPLEKIDYLNINDSRNDSFSANNLSFNQENPDNMRALLDEELLAAEDIFEETKAVLLSLLSPIVAREMQNLYGESWERYTIVRPPWSTKDVLKCAIKHWMAAVSESFTRRAEPILKELLETVTHPPDGGRRLKDVSYVLESCNDLFQTLLQQKYPQLVDKTASALNALKQRCLEETRKIGQRRIRDEIGHDENIARQDRRAEVALEYFNKVYAFTRDFCGVAAEAISMPCPFLFEKNDKRLSVNFVNNHQPVVAANLNHLLQIFSLALEDINGLRPDHKSIMVLTEALTTFFPDEFNDPNVELSPLDLYYCIKSKEDIMKRGLNQFQELSEQFCRMASFRALEDINGLRPDHKSIMVLTEALTTFFPDEFNDPNVELSPLDLYYCIKSKEDIMKRGLNQFQELSEQFCRMASFRCR